MASSWVSWASALSATLGDSSFLNEAIVMWVNGNGGAHHNGFNDHVVGLIGNPGRRLRSGRYVSRNQQHGERGNKRFVSDVFVTAANALGVDIDSFGDAAHSNGPIDELLA